MLHYLAYGSNLLPRRLEERVPDSRPLASVRLDGYRLSFRKIGRDGSGKCDLVEAEDAVAWGAVYRIPASGRQALDRAEGPDYAVHEWTLDTDAGRLDCFCYLARPHRVDESLVPFEWYLDLVRHGARRHGFPEPYLRTLDAVRPVCDLDRDRHAHHRRLLAQ